MAEQRIEKDTFGDIAVGADRLWGAQTERSLHHFDISTEKMPAELIRALAWVKRSAARRQPRSRHARRRQGRRHRRRRRRGSRRQARRPVPALGLADGLGHADQHEHQRGDRQPRLELLGGPVGEGRLVHPNDDVNRSQSSNDVFPTAMHVAAVEAVVRRLLPAVAALRDTLAEKAAEFADDRQDRPHAPAGRDAADARPGDLGLGRAARPRHRARPRRAAAPLRARARRHGRRHRAERAARVRRARRCRAVGAARAALRHGAEQVRGARRARRDRLRARRAEDARRLARRRSPTTCAGSPRGRARASARSAFPRTSRAARSCRARSTRRSARR